ncbi:porin family protein [Epilithonimonas xixisoli]|uniref:Outer membrane protein with beta-barrel domain n=1 Tax=Epilithonimonas xixisoli TaxID=1476462 RepID=A0A4R8IGX2_9FLAO|nr:porin family protein [Epilithonimonas xixisoli]TDX86073.1 outer membrane protein with beta-barrel domain [Epilithonimonas xixisoli]
MKKIILIGAIALCGAMNAQTKFGVKAGYALSSVNTKIDGVDEEDMDEMDAMSTFYVGALVEHKLTDKFGLQAELLYSPMGAKYSESVGGDKYELKHKLGTLQLPIGAKYYPTESFALTAGLNFGFILSAKEEETWTEDGDSGSETNDIEDTSSLNLAPFIGAEYTLPMGLFFDARYNFGVSNLYNGEFKDEISTKNSFFQIGVGYKF